MATTSQVVTSSLPTAFEEFYKTGIAQQGTPGTSGYQAAIPGLIPSAFKLYGGATPETYAANIQRPLEAQGLYSGAQRVEPLTFAQKQVGSQLQFMMQPSQFQTGTAAATQGISGLQGLLNQQAQTVNAPSLNQYQMYGPDILSYFHQCPMHAMHRLIHSLQFLRLPDHIRKDLLYSRHKFRCV